MHFYSRTQHVSMFLPPHKDYCSRLPPPRQGGQQERTFHCCFLKTGLKAARLMFGFTAMLETPVDLPELMVVLRWGRLKDGAMVLMCYWT